MSLRAAHGAGSKSALMRVEVLPPDEQPRAQAGGADPLQAGRDPAGKVRSAAAASALARLPRRSRHVPRALTCDPKFASHNARRTEWQRQRLAELQAAHGHVSQGVAKMVIAAAWLYAAGEFAAELAAESGEIEGFKAAGTLTGTARQHELAAWELGAREAKAKPKPSDALWRSMVEKKPGAAK